MTYKQVYMMQKRAGLLDYAKGLASDAYDLVTGKLITNARNKLQQANTKYQSVIDNQQRQLNQKRQQTQADIKAAQAGAAASPHQMENLQRLLQQQQNQQRQQQLLNKYKGTVAKDVANQLAAAQAKAPTAAPAAPPATPAAPARQPATPANPATTPQTCKAQSAYSNDFSFNQMMPFFLGMMSSQLFNRSQGGGGGLSNPYYGGSYINQRTLANMR